MIVGRFQPEMALVSAGFDAHKDDLLGSLTLEEEDFAFLTQALMERMPPGRTAAVLEGQVTVDDYHGGMETGDGTVTTDKDVVQRPWLPLRADLYLLSKKKGLDDESGAGETDERDDERQPRCSTHGMISGEGPPGIHAASGDLLRDSEK